CPATSRLVCPFHTAKVEFKDSIFFSNRSKRNPVITIGKPKLEIDVVINEIIDDSSITAHPLE
ncbi:hypothetical protein, partial [Thermobacillus xylanilyticus]|uniref:hypothetical protein n=1 Tax=Thermobacillus xylanilyticus TaxID=76633 RepID=UPI00314075AF